MSTLERAIVIATEAHDGRLDRAGEPYILHPLRVMLAMDSPAGRIAGVLHDVVEDCRAWSTERLAGEGFGDDVVAAVDFLTRPVGEAYAVYIDRLVLHGTPLARAVKVQDLGDNLRLDRLGRLPASERERLETKYRPALRRLNVDLGPRRL